ncbi:YdcF family protein [Chryseobacterium sp.]|uniref:YdcF family protein n=1 Tax=Chryseobacterium sp. TaxID=1871047 RepID=UPI002626E1CA|nr:YdcF family protein [Chryseobacterium sp.]
MIKVEELIWQVVLGNKINEDGSLPERLKARLDQNIKLYHAGRVEKILVSGGLGKEGYWEGNKMEEYLKRNHIPQENIIVDNYGNNTEMTVKNTIRITDSLHFKSIISVSQYDYQTRIKKLFKENHFYAIESLSPDYFEIRDFYSIFREFFAYYS